MAEITMKRGNLIVTVDESEREVLERNGWTLKRKRANKPKTEEPPADDGADDQGADDQADADGEEETEEPKAE